MALTLEIKSASQLTTLDGLRLQLTARNSGPLAVSLPTTTDRSAALTVYAYRDSKLTHVANGLTQQDMMTAGRVDETTERELLAAGAERSWELDLTSSGYPLLAGDSSVYAECLLGDGSSVRSNTVIVPVQARQVQALALDRSNPVLDGMCLLLESPGADGPELRLRLYNSSRPLAPWFSTLLPALGSQLPVLATPNFFLTDTFDHFFLRWLVTVDEGKLRALKFSSGLSTGREREAALPVGRRLIAAIQGVNDELLVFLRGPSGELECCDFSDAGLSLRFARKGGAPGASASVIGARADRLVLVTAEHGIDRLDLDYQGAELAEQHLFDTDLATLDVRYDPVSDEVKAGFWDGAQGEHLQLVVGHEGKPQIFYQERSGAQRDLFEVSWDRDPAGEFHVVGNTASGLYYWTRGVVPRLLLAASGPRLPRVLAQRRPCIALYDPERGYNVYEYRDGLRFREGPWP
jgi:hypothetical protein